MRELKKLNATSELNTSLSHTHTLSLFLSLSFFYTQFMRELKKLNDTADWTFSRPNSSSNSTGGEEGEGTRRSSVFNHSPDYPNGSTILGPTRPMDSASTVLNS
jgi:hypothetical protein